MHIPQVHAEIKSYSFYTFDHNIVATEKTIAKNIKFIFLILCSKVLSLNRNIADVRKHSRFLLSAPPLSLPALQNHHRICQKALQNILNK